MTQRGEDSTKTTGRNDLLIDRRSSRRDSVSKKIGVAHQVVSCDCQSTRPTIVEILSTESLNFGVIVAERHGFVEDNSVKLLIITTVDLAECCDM